MDKRLRLNKLQAILERYGVAVLLGKGSEIKLKFRGKIHIIGRHKKNPEIPREQIRMMRRKFALDAEHGVSDDDFYGKG